MRERDLDKEIRQYRRDVSKTGRACIFENPEAIKLVDLESPQGRRLLAALKENGHICWGRLTRHHVLFRCEGGTDNQRNIVPMCEGHQEFVHSKPVWGGKDFSYLRRLHEELDKLHEKQN